MRTICFIIGVMCLFYYIPALYEPQHMEHTIAMIAYPVHSEHHKQNGYS